MPAQRHVFTSESVTEGHPDKIADQISDAVLDAIIAKDPDARVACETLVTTGMAVIAGEITTSTYVHIPDIVRGTIASIGYTDANFGFDAQTCAVVTTIDRQSADIARGVDTGGAGDQGMMFGYATDETPSLMPLPIVLAHRLAERLAIVRKGGDPPWLRPDGKTQVSVVYENGRPVGVSKLGVSTQHSDKIDNKEIRAGVIALVVRPVRAETGPAARDPVAVMVDTFGTGVVPDDALEDAVREVFDLQPRGIIEALSLRNPIYRCTAAYGHFGRAPERRRFVDPDVTKEVECFTWERVNRVEDLRLAVQRSRHFQAAKATA